MKGFSDYKAQTILKNFGLAGQAKLAKSKVVIVGAGGLGCPVAIYLAGAGVGEITIIDMDKVSQTNLHRQIVFSPQDISKPKAEVLVKKLSKQFLKTSFSSKLDGLTSNNATKLIRGADLVVDCTDNFMAHYALSDVCQTFGIPHVYGAGFQYEGQFAVLNLKNDDGTFSASYRDLWPEPTLGLSCEAGGIMPTLTGIIGLMQANETIKILTGAGKISRDLTIVDTEKLKFHSIKLPKRSGKVKTNTLIKEIRPSSLKSYLAKNYPLIDVRSKADHSAYNIGGESIPLNSIDPTKLAYKKAIFYCQSGMKSAYICHKMSLAQPGGDYYSLAGGINAIKGESTI